MTESTSRANGTRLGGHVRRHIAGYLAIVLALSLTPAMASHLNVRSSDLAKNAVTTPKIKNKAVTGPKMANLENRRTVRQAQFSNGGQGDCIWQGGGALLPGLGNPHYYKDHLGIVHLGGVGIATDGAGGDGDCSTVGESEDGIVFRLPSAYRPRFTEIHFDTDLSILIVGQTALVSGPLSLPPGTVYASTTFDPPQAAMDGITFRASQAGGVSARQVTTLDRDGQRLLRRLLNRDL